MISLEMRARLGLGLNLTQKRGVCWMDDIIICR
jgi:hypothetical protein